MVREVHLSWDSEQPYPAELERSDWDSDEVIFDLPVQSPQRQRVVPQKVREKKKMIEGNRRAG